MLIDIQKIRQLLEYLRWRSKYKHIMNSHSVKVLSFEDSWKKIIEERCSVSRYGDGELRMMLLGDHGATFEVNSKRLADELREIIKADKNNLLVCLPNVYSGMAMMKFDARVIWMGEVSRLFPKYCQYLNGDYHYGDAFITRPYHDYVSNSQTTKKRFELIKKLWNARPVLIVEGRLTRFGVGNDLLSNASTVDRILCPEINAFEKFDDIYSIVKKYIDVTATEDLLVLLALGPTATVMAAKLSQNLNIQAIDIGHLDIEYEWFRLRTNKKIQIEGKYVNEARGPKYIEGKSDYTYLKSIYSTVS